MFKLNQRVWSHIFGWGVVVKLTNNFVVVKPDTSNLELERYFCYDGKMDKRDLFPSLFHNEVKEWPNPKPDLSGKIFVSTNKETWFIRIFKEWHIDGRPICYNDNDIMKCTIWCYYKEMKDG